MIDIHSHVLPNVDDGARSLAIALAMLDDYVRLGYSTVVATPHWEYPTNQDQQTLIQLAYEELAKHANDRGLKLLLGRECMLPPDPIALSGNTQLTLNGSNFILVEVPFNSRPLFLEESLFGLQTAGKTVILAHPERYRFIQRDLQIARTLSDRGFLFQINIGSLAGTYGSTAEKAAEWLVRNGLVHFAATDAHSDGNGFQSVAAGLIVLNNLIGAEDYQLLVHLNSELVLSHTSSIPTPARPQKGRQSILRNWLRRVR